MTSPGYIYDSGYEDGIDSLTSDINKLQDTIDKLEQATKNIMRGIAVSIEYDCAPLVGWYEANKGYLRELGGERR